MIILTLRTDKPEAELGLYDDHTKLFYEVWQAHRELAETIHVRIEEILNKSSNSLDSLEGIVCYKGPGSFTGLRIGLAVANALAYSEDIPIAGSTGENWIKEGIDKFLSGHNDKLVVPEYGSAPNTTKPRQ